MSERAGIPGKLTTTSYAILGLIEFVGPATPYQLKQMAALTLGNFWSLPHTQLYDESARLAQGGYVTEEREQTGRRRKIYAITDLGRQTLEEWRSEPCAELPEVRAESLVRLFFGAAPIPLATAQVEALTAYLKGFEELRAAVNQQSMPDGMRWVVEAGVAFAGEVRRFWQRVLAEAQDGR